MSFEPLTLMLILFLLEVHKNTARQSCDESLSSKNGKFSKQDITDLISNENQLEIKTCLVLLGKNPLNPEIAGILWKDLVKVL